VPGTAAEGWKKLVEFQQTCAGLAAEKEIAARLKKAETDKAIKAEIAACKLALEADALLAEAQRARDAGDAKTAERAVRRLLAKRFAECAAAKKAREAWPEIAADEDGKGKK
jgi:hypothetical protein